MNDGVRGKWTWQNKETKAYLLAILVVLSWASAPIVFRAGFKSMTFDLAVFWFLLIGGVFLVLVNISKMANADKKKLLVFSGFIGIFQAVHYLCYTSSLASQEVSLTVAIVKTSTLFQFIFAVILLKSKFTVKTIIGIIICVIGVIIVAGPKINQSSQLAIPIIVSLIAAIAWGFMLVAISKSKQDEFLVTGFSLLWGALFVFLGKTFFGDGVVLPGKFMDWIILFYLGVIPTAVAVAWWASALKIMKNKNKESKIIVFDFFTPVIAVFASWIFFAENLSLLFMSGLFAIIIGSFLISWKFKKKEVQNE